MRILQTKKDPQNFIIQVKSTVYYYGVDESEVPQLVSRDFPEAIITKISNVKLGTQSSIFRTRKN